MGEGKWKNKTRTLVIGSRGLDYRSRHFMEDLRRMMAHAKADTKLEKKNERGLLREMAEMKNCSKVLYFEGRKKKDLFLTVADVDEGPTIRFNVEGLSTMGELKFNGNALKTSRPLLSFDAQFDEEPHWAVVKELFTQTFGTPKYHPKSQPFVDHVLQFSLHDGRVWMRNYQIILEGENKVKEDKFAPELVEIGPRIVLTLQRIQEGPFSGAAIYLNPDYVGPNERRRNALNLTDSRGTLFGRRNLSQSRLRWTKRETPQCAESNGFKRDPFRAPQFISIQITLDQTRDAAMR